MEPMTDELKEAIIREYPNGIWLVLAEEYPPDIVTAHDLLCGRHKAEVIPFPRPRANDQCVVNPVLIDWNCGAPTFLNKLWHSIREADTAK
jgi:hypothetical protein